MERLYSLPSTAPIKGFERKQAEGWLPYLHCEGLIPSNEGTDATNDLAFTAGACRSSVNIIDGSPSILPRDQRDIEIPVSIIKQLDVAWAPDNYDPDGFSGGDRSGGRSASAISNTTWHCLAIGGRRVKGDILFHDALTQASVLAALPQNYTAYRRIFSVCRIGAALQVFTFGTDGYVRLKTPTLDFDTSTLTTAASTITLASIPTGLSLRILANTFVSRATEGFVYIKNPSDTDTAPSASLAPLATIKTDSTGGKISAEVSVVTNTSAQIAARSDGAGTTLRIAPLGWWEARRD